MSRRFWDDDSSIKKISSKRAWRTISGGSRLISLAVATRKTGMRRSAVQVTRRTALVLREGGTDGLLGKKTGPYRDPKTAKRIIETRDLSNRQASASETQEAGINPRGELNELNGGYLPGGS